MKWSICLPVRLLGQGPRPRRVEPVRPPTVQSGSICRTASYQTAVTPRPNSRRAPNPACTKTAYQTSHGGSTPRLQHHPAADLSWWSRRRRGPGQEGKPVLRSWRLVGGLQAAAGDERVEVERPQPRSGEDDDLDARGTGGTMKRRKPGGCQAIPGVAGPGAREPRSSLYRRLDGRTMWMEGFAPVAHLIGALCQARDYAAPAGAKGLFVDSMCQIASDSRRAKSTWATLGPR